MRKTKGLSFFSSLKRQRKIDRAAKLWGLEVQQIVVDKNSSTICKVNGPFGVGALKIPGKYRADRERNSMRFLSSLDADMTVQIHDSDPGIGAVLMEWLDGPCLSQITLGGNDALSTKVLARMASRIRQTNFRDTNCYSEIAPQVNKTMTKAKNFTRLTSDSLCKDLQQANEVLKNLLESERDIRLIHGDLHHGNVILTNQGPKVLDAKGYLAEGAFELAHALRSPFREISSAEFRLHVDHRLEDWAQSCDTSPKRLLMWSAVKCAHSICLRSKSASNQDQNAEKLRVLLEMAEARPVSQ